MKCIYLFKNKLFDSSTSWILRIEAEKCDTNWLFELRFKECPENIIEMIASKLDENNLEESKIKELWEKNKIQIKEQNILTLTISLSDKLNNIISKLDNKKLEYYKPNDLNEYNLIL